MATLKHTKPHIRETNRTRSTLAAEHFNREDADILGTRAVLTQIGRDTFGTKDIQDADTATHAWIAGQVGHLVLGGVPTLIFCWLSPHLWALLLIFIGLLIPVREGVQTASGALTLVIALWWFFRWVIKELQDFSDTKGRAGDVFTLDEGDICWNVKTALFYIGAGWLLALAAFFGTDISLWLAAHVVSLPPGLMPYLPVILLALVLILPALRIAYWWLRRKLNFQQAGLPFFYRLSNFKRKIEPETRVADIVSLANAQEKKPTRLFDVVFKPDRPVETSPPGKHLLISGPLASGKTSLAVGIGNEYALTLQIGRYLTAVKLLQLLEQSGPVPREEHPVLEQDCGRLLWPWQYCDLLIIDDVDGGSGSDEKGQAIDFIRPFAFAEAIRKRAEYDGLYWLGKRRSVWVVSDRSEVEEWRAVIGKILGAEVETVTLQRTPPDATRASSTDRHQGGDQVKIRGAVRLAAFLGGLVYKAP